VLIAIIRIAAHAHMLEASASPSNGSPPGALWAVVTPTTPATATLPLTVGGRSWVSVDDQRHHRIR
jgi:hypothetical protein